MAGRDEHVVHVALINFTNVNFQLVYILFDVSKYPPANSLQLSFYYLS